MSRVRLNQALGAVWYLVAVVALVMGVWILLISAIMLGLDHFWSAQRARALQDAYAHEWPDQ